MKAAADLEAALRDTAKALGLRIRVTHETRFQQFYIDASLSLPRVNVTIDEACLTMSGAPDVLNDELEHLQLRLHDLARDQMAERDVRKRIVKLSNEDKHTLHRMYLAACNEVSRDFSETGTAKLTEFQELMNRLFR